MKLFPYASESRDGIFNEDSWKNSKIENVGISPGEAD